MHDFGGRRRGNVTMPADAMAVAVDDPEIPYVMSTRTGAELNVRQFIQGRRYDRLVHGVRDVILDAVRARKPRLICPVCSVPVTLASSPLKRFYFRHVREDGSCPAVTRTASADQIRAMRYNGQRESEAHRLTKLAVAESLEADAAFSKIMIEKSFRSRSGKGLRRPDVQAEFSEIMIAFEIQLTRTFLDVVRGRRAFYLENDALLIWVLRQFRPNYRRMTEDDILFSNNSNIIVVDENTLQISKEKNQFFVHVFYRVPYVSLGMRAERWESEIVPFSRLTLDRDNQRAFLFDFEVEDRRIEIEIRQHKKRLLDEHRRHEEELQRKAEVSLKEKIISLCLEIQATRDVSAGDYQEIRQRWSILADVARMSNASFPQDVNYDLCRLVAVFRSAQLGKPIGYKFEELIEIVHMVDNSWKPAFFPLWYAIKIYGHEELVWSQDRKEKLRRRFDAIETRNPEASQLYDAPLNHIEILRWLFPRLATLFI